MLVKIIAFTENGYHLEKRIQSILQRKDYTAEVFLKSKYFHAEDVRLVNNSLGDWAAEEIPDSDVLIFVGATGIAVRTIAPFVKSKKTDPAVLVIDEKGTFVISLLSGHLGGANAMTAFLAEELRSIAVITTATDLNHRFAVDVFAKKNHLRISDMRLAKEVSALILQGTTLKAGVGSGYSRKAVIPDIPELNIEKKDSPDGIKGTFWIQTSEQEILHLIPKNMILGIGCKRNTCLEKIEELVWPLLKEEGIFPDAIAAICSIDLKKEEEGLIAFSQKQNVPFETFSSLELGNLEGDFTPSAFVSKITGVDNVCERSALMGSGKDGQFMIRKTAQNGVTVSCVVKEWSVEYE